MELSHSPLGDQHPHPFAHRTNCLQAMTGDMRQRTRAVPPSTLRFAATNILAQLLNVHDTLVHGAEQPQKPRLIFLQAALVVATNNLIRFAYCLSKVSTTASLYPPAPGNATFKMAEYRHSSTTVTYAPRCRSCRYQIQRLSSHLQAWRAYYLGTRLLHRKGEDCDMRLRTA